MPVARQHSPVHEVGRPLPKPLLARIGGRRSVECLIDRLYDHIDSVPEVRALFPADLDAGRAKQKLFFEQWLGGGPPYSQRYGSPRLRQRHVLFSISRRRAERWLDHMSAAMRECGVEDGVANEIMEALRPLARHFVNQPEPAAAGQPECDAPDPQCRAWANRRAAARRDERRTVYGLAAFKLDLLARHDPPGLDLGVDTTTPSGEVLANVMASFAQSERKLIGQRTREALAQRGAGGVRLGRWRRSATTSTASGRAGRAVVSDHLPVE